MSSVPNQPPEPATGLDPLIVALRSLYRVAEDEGNEAVMAVASGTEFLYRLGAEAGAAELVEAIVQRVAAEVGGAVGQPEDEGAAGDPAPHEIKEKTL